MCFPARPCTNTALFLPTCKGCRHRELAFGVSLSDLNVQHADERKHVQRRIEDLKGDLDKARRSVNLESASHNIISPSESTVSTILPNTAATTARIVTHLRPIDNPPTRKNPPGPQHVPHHIPSGPNTPRRNSLYAPYGTTCSGCLFRDDCYVETYLHHKHSQWMHMSQQLQIVEQLEKELQALNGYIQL